MSDEHGHGPSNDKPWLAALAVIGGLAVALGIGRVDPYGASAAHGATSTVNVRGLDPIEGTIHAQGGVLQVHTAKGMVFVPADRAQVHAAAHEDAHEDAHAAHPEGESVSGEPRIGPLDELALRAFNRRNSRLYAEALPLYAELATRGADAHDPRAAGWQETLGQVVREYVKDWHAGEDALERARRVRETLEPLPGMLPDVWLADAYATLLRIELAEANPTQHAELGELLEALGPTHTSQHRDVLDQLQRRLHPAHEQGGLLPPGR